MTANTIEYFYAAHSAYAYLGTKALAQIAQDSGWRVVHRPFDYLPVVQAASPHVTQGRTVAHIEYFFGRELRRWSQWRDLPMISRRPSHHDNPLALASGMIIAATDPDRVGFGILQAHWRDDADIADADTLLQIAQECGEDAQALLKMARSTAVSEQFSANTKEAIARSVFGSPTYFVGGDMFYGQDRLELVARAIKQPFDP